MRSNPLLRPAPWLLLLLVAFAVGRWHAQRSNAAETAVLDAHAARNSAAVSQSPPTRADLLAQIAAIAERSRTMSTPDAATYAFFEKLPPEHVDAVTKFIETMPRGNEQDVLFAFAIRRWAEIDGPAALERAGAFPVLSVRISTRTSVFEHWAMKQPAAAFERARAEPDATTQDRATMAALSGAAMVDPRQAYALWQQAPGEWRESSIGLAALRQIASAANGTGQRETVMAMVDEITDESIRLRLVDALAREWGAHYPDEALAWIRSTISEGAERDTVMQDMFASLAEQDPPRAAEWALNFGEERRRLSLIAAAIQQWVAIDPIGAETWIDAQEAGRQLDGATYAIAAHFITQHEWERAFGWIRRINAGEARAEMLGNLGLLWSKEQPTEFKKFLDQASLNRFEVEMLLAKIGPTS